MIKWILIMSKIEPSQKMVTIGLLVYFISTLFAIIIGIQLYGAGIDIMKNIGSMIFLWFIITCLVDILVTIGKLSEMPYTTLSYGFIILLIINFFFTSIPLLFLGITSSFENTIIFTLTGTIPQLPVFFQVSRFFLKKYK